MTAPTTRETADHAELLRRALQDAQELSRRGLNPDVRLNAAEREAVTHLLSEIAALRGEVAQSKREYRDDVGKHIARAAQAKRQRDELRKALERIASVDMGGGFLGALACRQVANQALANQGADQ